jgi:glycosyltransferase involved in cell wall biosynthesis
VKKPKLKQLALQALQKVARHPLLRPLYKDFVLLRELSYFRRLRTRLLALEPDVVLSFLFNNNFLTLLALRGTHVPVVVSERNVIKSERRIDHHAFLRRITYRWAHNVIAQTQSAKADYLEQTGLDRCIVIPNPIKRLAPASTATDATVILSVGRLVVQTGHHLLLDAFARLSAPAWRLVIVGEGPEKVALERRAAELGVAERTEFCGWKSNVDDAYAKASVFVLPSLREGFPNVLAEAMASGLCCVSFNCDFGPQDLIVESENGFLVPVGDVDALALRLQYVIDHAEIRATVGAKAREVSLRLDICAISDLYLATLNEAFVSNHAAIP